MSKPDQKTRKLKKRKTRASVGGISQSGFANRAMSNAQQAASSSTRKKSGDDDDQSEPSI